ncbi:MAG: DUF5700 domain-containing putative Zn-dependent protease [Acidobacteriota bacterium]|nr:DUF5700 domain-containing putative Zn-dependent protease [Acidobacteriota bacterium]
MVYRVSLVVAFAGMILVALSTAPLGASQEAGAAAVDVRMETDEADAALAILHAHRAGEPVAEEAWGRLFESEGYRRLQQRERSMGREFQDSAFQEFLLSDPVVASAPALAEAVADWRQADLTGAAGRALAYLPAGTKLRATLYPAIKPRPNSFVFEVESDPAIFIHLDPTVPRAKLENTLAHELHHIGYAAACGAADSELTDRVRTAVRWAGAFGEGLAMLAAAGGPSVHPHAASSAEERARWDRDVANVEADLRRVEMFLLDVAEGRLSDPDAVRAAAMEFFGVQGPWYTVGWKMAVTIEEAFGRERLIEVMCDPRRLMATYNAAAQERNRAGGDLPLWSSSLLALLDP